MPPPGYWDEEDEWYSHTDRYAAGGARHVPPPRRGARMDDFGRRSDHFLAPETERYSSGLHRTRSQGHAPQPNVTIYNTTKLENESNPRLQADQRSPLPSPRHSPRGRPLRMANEWALEDELAELRLEVARGRRSRSRSRHYHEEPNSDYEKWQLQLANERLKEAEERLQQEKREELIKKRLELKYLKDKHERDEEDARIKAEEDRWKKDYELKNEREERKRAERLREAEAERKRIIDENTLKIERQEREVKEARQRAVDEYNAKKQRDEAEAKAARERAIADYERKKSEDEQKAKRQREELVMQLKIEEEKKKEKEKAEWEAFLLKQKQKEEEEKKKKEAEQARLDDLMHKRLAQFGFQENQIQAMIKPEKVNNLQQGLAPINPVQLGHQPTYVKVHKDHLSIDTLTYYDIPYEVDRADPNYIIVLREMDNRETEILFEHTRRLRTRGTSRLLIEERDRQGDKDYAWVRRRKHTPSPHRRRSSPKRVIRLF